MKIAVVQHALRAAPAQDLEALVIAVARAAAAGAEIVFLPDVVALHDGPLGDELFCRIAEDAPDVTVVPAHRDPADADGPLHRSVGALGEACLLIGDDAMDPAAHAPSVTRGAGLLVLAPGSESELQAQAMLELAIGLSTSLASVVVVAETDGAPVGEAGHGGSTIVHLGQILSEAMAGDDLLIGDVPVPLGPPEAPAAIPEIPPVLEQRLGAHRGQKPAVGYPADLD